MVLRTRRVNYEERERTMSTATATTGATPTATIVDDNTNPFACAIKIGDKVGNSLFVKATNGLDDDEKLSFDLEKAQHFKDEIDSANAKYVWGSVTFAIANSAGDNKDLLEEWSELTLDDVIAHSQRIWSCGHDHQIPSAGPTLTEQDVQKRICSVMMSGFIRNSLSKSARKTMDLQRKKFQFKHAVDGRIKEDGPIMLKLIYDRINPSTRAGIRNLTDELDKMTLTKYEQAVPKMLDDFETKYELILSKKGTYPNVVLLLFNTLSTSTNKDFSNFVDKHLNKWEEGDNYSFELLKNKAITKYNNLIERYKRQGPTYSEKCSGITRAIKQENDPKIMALTTEYEKMKKELNQLKSALLSSSGTGNTQAFSNDLSIATWRKKKSFGDKIFKDGRQWFWCNHHKNTAGGYDGLYVTHPEEKHGEWKERKDRERQEQKGRKVGTENANPNVSMNQINRVHGRASLFYLISLSRRYLPITDSPSFSWSNFNRHRRKNNGPEHWTELVE